MDLDLILIGGLIIGMTILLSIFQAQFLSLFNDFDNLSDEGIKSSPVYKYFDIGSYIAYGLGGAFIIFGLLKPSKKRKQEESSNNATPSTPQK
jgi:hypothetical protein